MNAQADPLPDKAFYGSAGLFVSSFPERASVLIAPPAAASGVLYTLLFAARWQVW